jgi:hypothetical protein
MRLHPNREKGGLRIDQLGTAEEIEKMFRTCRTWYQEEKPLFERAGIYSFLHLNIDLWLGGKACDVLDGRRKKAEQAAA